MEKDTFGLSTVPDSVEFTDKLLYMPTLAEIGLSRLAAGLPVPETLGEVKGGYSPDSLTNLSRKPSSCWITRGMTILRYSIAIESFFQERSWFKNKTVEKTNWVTVEITSPVSGMIVGFRSSDIITFSNSTGLGHSSLQGECIRNDNIPIILIPQDEPPPSPCGYSQLMNSIKHYRNALKIQMDNDYSSAGWIKLEYSSDEGKELFSEFENFNSFDEPTYFKASNIDPKRDAFIIKYLDFMRCQDRGLSVKLSHLVRKHSPNNWLQ